MTQAEHKEDTMTTDSKDVFDGDLTAKPGVVYNYTRVGGTIDARGADTKTAFPKLTSVGGSIYARPLSRRIGRRWSASQSLVFWPRVSKMGGATL